MFTRKTTCYIESFGSLKEAITLNERFEDSKRGNLGRFKRVSFENVAESEACENIRTPPRNNVAKILHFLGQSMLPLASTVYSSVVFDPHECQNNL